MTILNIQKNRKILLTVLLLVAIFNSFLFFLNIPMGFLILTPLRFVLVALSALVGVDHLMHFRKSYEEKRKELPTENRLTSLARVLLSPLKRLPNLFLALLLVWTLVCVIWYVLTPLNSFGKAELVGIGTLFLFAFVFFGLTRNKQDVIFVSKILLGSFLFLALFAIAESIFGSFIPGGSNVYTLEEKISLEKTLFAPTGGYTNPNDLASLLSVGFVIVQYRILKSRNTKETVHNLLLLLILLLPTVLIGSTILNTIFFVMSVVLLGLMYYYRSSDPLLARRKIFLYVITVALYFLVLRHLLRFAVVELNSLFYTARIESYLANAGGEISFDITTQNMLSLSATVEDQLQDFSSGFGTIHIRLWLIYFGLCLFAGSPLIGVGPGNFRSLIVANHDILMQTREIVDPHNFYIELLSEFGLILFLPFVLLIIWALRKLFRRVHQETATRWNRHAKKRLRSLPGLSLLAILLLVNAAMVCILSSSILRFTSLWLCFFLPLAILHVLETGQNEKPRKLPKES